MGSKTRAGLLVGLALAVAVAVPAASQARTLYGTTDGGKLVTFADKQTKTKIKVKKGAKPKTAKAVQITATRTVVGLPAGVRLVGIDVRPVTGELYGVGSDSIMYKLIVTSDRTALALNSGSVAPPSLSGTFFGVDFNPVPDRLRIISNTGQNLRADPNGTTAPSTGVAPPAATQAPTANDGAINPGTPQVVAAAYLNSAYSAVKPTTTTLFVVDTSTDTLFVQNPPNAGTLTTPVKLSVPVGNDVGFDIAGAANQPYLTNDSTLYRLNTATGAATKIGDVATVTKKGKVKKAVLTGLAAVQD